MKQLFIFIFLFLSFQAFALEKNSYKLNCNGNEPFWSVSINGPSLELKFPGEKYSFKNATVLEATGAVAGYVFEIESSKLRISISKDDCSDGMSDFVYKYQAIVRLDNMLLIGCCDPK